VNLETPDNGSSRAEDSAPDAGPDQPTPWRQAPGGGWKVGDVILDLYEVKQIHQSGGMSLVYRVHHRGWGIDLALKCPRPQLFLAERHKRLFEREADTWVGLGPHPHTATCHYVRRIDGLPCIFAEYVVGGSLSQWIRDRRLYAGGPQQALVRTLDVAVQLAWGLHHAHQHGLVHRDVKPGNVLLTDKGAAKVTDFGLARAQAASAAPEAADSTAGLGQRGLLVSAGGMTPAYCSPEQFRRRRVSSKTDIWSWAVSVLEMFRGEVTWTSGVVAAEALEEFVADAAPRAHLPRLPGPVLDLLRQCFQQQPEARPRDMWEIAERLKEAYREASGRPYPRRYSQPIDARSPGLNNRAISMLDLGKQQQAEELWQKALAVEPLHPESTYNLGLLHWRSRRISGEELIRQLRQVCASRPGEWLPLLLLAQVHLEREECTEAQAALTRIREADHDRPEVQALSARARDRLRYGLRPVQVLTGYGGHAKGVLAVAISGDGRLGLSGSWDATLKLWNLAAGLCLRTLEGHRDAVTAASLSPDARRALSGSRDGTLRLWEVATGRCLHVYAGHSGPVTSVVPGPDWRYALSGSRDQTLKLWDLATGLCVRTLEDPDAPVNAVDLDAAGQRALCGVSDRRSGQGAPLLLRLWDLRTGRRLLALPGNASAVRCVRFDQAGTRALSGGMDGLLHLWDLPGSRLLRTLRGHAAAVTGACFAADGQCAYSVGEDGCFAMWDLQSGKCLRTTPVDKESLSSLCIAADGRHALIGSEGRAVTLWRLDPDRRSPSRVSDVLDGESASSQQEAYERACRQADATLARGDAVTAARRLRQARRQAGYQRKAEAVDQWCALYVWLPRTTLNAAWEVCTLSGHRAGITAVGLTRDGRFAASASKDRLLKWWDLAGGACLRSFKGHQRGVCALHLSADGQLLLSGSKDATLRLWDTETGACRQTFAGHRQAVTATWMSADGRFALSASRDATLKLWEAAGGRCLRTYKGHKSGIVALAVSADERLALTAAADGMVKVWDVAAGCCTGSLQCAEALAHACLWADGGRALGSGGDRLLQVWDLVSGQALQKFRGHGDRVSALCLSADGRHALSGSGDRTLKLWQVDTGGCLRTFEGHADRVTAACLSADGRYALSGGEDAALKLWLLDWELEDRAAADWDEEARPALRAFLTLHTPQGALSLRPWLTQAKVTQALTRQGKPAWDEDDFNDLLYTLGCAGYGWLRTEGVRGELERMAATWNGPPPLWLTRLAGRRGPDGR
jgi:WD40 repeat protein/serine/threonine protein kinase